VSCVLSLLSGLHILGIQRRSLIEHTKSSARDLEVRGRAFRFLLHLFLIALVLLPYQFREMQLGGFLQPSSLPAPVTDGQVQVLAQAELRSTVIDPAPGLPQDMRQDLGVRLDRDEMTRRELQIQRAQQVQLIGNSVMSHLVRLADSAKAQHQFGFR
jgi:hypothetical protein